MSVEDNLKYLEECSPESLRSILEDGTIVNIADLIATALDPAATLKILKQGLPWQVSHGIGLGIRQHDDVMLSYGYSKVTHVDFLIPDGEYAMVALTVPEGVKHHAEGRILTNRYSTVEIWIVPNYVPALPAGGTDMVIWNQQGPTKEAVEDRRSVFTSWLQATNPIGTDPVYGEYMEHSELYGIAAQGAKTVASGSDLESVHGRYYYPNNHIVLIKNIGGNGDDAKVTYDYTWHDFT